MNIEKITDAELVAETSNRFARAELRGDTSTRICIHGFLMMAAESEGIHPRFDLLAGYTKGQYKRAIKLLRATQVWAARHKPELVEGYDSAAQYIRKRCLHRGCTEPRQGAADVEVLMAERGKRVYL